MRKLATVVIGLLAVGMLLFLLWFDGAGEAKPPAKPTPAPPYAGTIRGIVLDSGGRPIDGAVVTARLTASGPVYEVRSPATGPDGRFSLLASPPRGRWAFRVDLRDGSGFDPPETVAIAAGQTREVTLRPPNPERAATPAKKKPNLGGYVSDDTGRILQGMEVVAVGGKGRVLGRARSDRRGRFAMRVDAPPGFRLELAKVPARAQCLPIHVPALYVFDYWLLVSRPKPGMGELRLGVRLTAPLPADRTNYAWFRFLNSRGEERRNVHLELRNETYRFDLLPYGIYDILVKGQGFAGIVQGFEFTPTRSYAGIDVGPGAAVRGSLSRKARVVLFSSSPTFVPLDVEAQKNAAVLGSTRGVAAKTRASASRFEFRGIPAGRYRIRITAADAETFEKQFVVEAGRDVDFGRIDLAPATGRVRVRIIDRANAPETREFTYEVLLMDLGGHVLRLEALPGPADPVVFTNVPSGSWYLRAGRELEQRGHTRRHGDDILFKLKKGGERKFSLKENWR